MYSNTFYSYTFTDINNIKRKLRIARNEWYTQRMIYAKEYYNVTYEFPLGQKDTYSYQFVKHLTAHV